MGAVAESRRKENNPRVSTRFSLSVENEQADAGQDGRTCLARSKSQTRTGAGKTYFSLLILDGGRTVQLDSELGQRTFGIKCDNLNSQQ